MHIQVSNTSYKKACIKLFSRHNKSSLVKKCYRPLSNLEKRAITLEGLKQTGCKNIYRLSDVLLTTKRTA